MEFKKYNPFFVKPKAKGASPLTPQQLFKPKPKPKTKLEAKHLWHIIDEAGSRMNGVLSLESKKKLDIVYAKGLVNLVGNSIELSL